MKEATYLPVEQLSRRAIEALVRELGPVETTRFLTLPRSKQIDSLERHRRWQLILDEKAFFNEVFGAG